MNRNQSTKTFGTEYTKTAKHQTESNNAAKKEESSNEVR